MICIDTIGSPQMEALLYMLPHHKGESSYGADLESKGIEVAPKHARSYVVLCWYQQLTESTYKHTFKALKKIIEFLEAEGKVI